MKTEVEILSWLSQEPASNEIDFIGDSKFIPIEIMEGLLDSFDSWSTQNFHWSLFRDSYSNNGVAASIELVVEYEGKTRTFVGACNFSMKSLYPNPHFLATAKSECVKNAASDIGIKLGRGLNRSIVPDKANESAATGGVDLHDSIEQYKLKTDVTESQNIEDKNS